VADPITLYIFPGMNASFTLYEDESTNYNYEKDQYSTIAISYDEATRAVTIGDRQGSFPGMAESRKFELVWVDDHQEGVGLTARPQQVVQYSGAQVKISPKPNK
jgi:alpha-D-xyloside xylohydrolase